MARALFVGTALIAASAAAQPRANLPALVGATESVKLAPAAGFIDEPIAMDDQRLAYVVANAADNAELHVVTLATKQEVVINLAPITVIPTALELVGNRVFVSGQAEEGKQIAALIELSPQGKKPAGAIVYKLGPATHITVVTQNGKPRVAVHRATATKDGTRHEVELVAIDSGRRIAGPHALELDAANANKQLEFRVNHWSDGMSRAHGLKGGDWDRKENTRSPDVEATYDLVTGSFVDRHPIEDLLEQRKRYQALADAGGRLDFVHMTWDNTAVQIWHAGKAKAIELDQPLSIYEPKSLQGVVAADGSAWIALTVDPVNADAVAHKHADPEYLDVFQVGADGKATRKARVLATQTRHRFGVLGTRFWLLERSRGSDRGGRSLAVYQLP